MTSIDRFAGQNNNLDRMAGHLDSRGATWSLQDAKNRFSAVVDAALAGRPQRVTRRGKPAVVVLRVDDYEHLRRLQHANAPTFGDLLLAIPQDGGEFERARLPPRPVDF